MNYINLISSTQYSYNRLAFFRLPIRFITVSHLVIFYEISQIVCQSYTCPSDPEHMLPVQFVMMFTALLLSEVSFTLTLEASAII